MKHRRLLVLSLLMSAVALVPLTMRIGYPHHRALSLALYLAAWIPLLLSYRINRRLLRTHRKLLQRKVRPYVPHIVAGLILIAVAYIAWVLAPVVDSPLSSMTDGELRERLRTDIASCFALNRSVGTLLDDAEERGLLKVRVDQLSSRERDDVRRGWRDGVMAFYEYELLKATYRGFHQIDYVAKPSLHADAFFAAYSAYVSQYNACLRLVELVGDNESVETLLNEKGGGVPANTYASIKQRLTRPDVLLRLNAGAAYYGLVKKDFTVSPDMEERLERQRAEAFGRLGKNPELFVDNPLDVLEQASFKAWFPLQKQVALHMSRVRTTRRDYFITPGILTRYKERLKPGDIMVQRRNWHMTNIGIPGFWPHAALYVGSLAQLDATFSDVPLLEGRPPSAYIRDRFPHAYRALSRQDEDGFDVNVIESIRPGVVLQSLERSAHADYLGVIRPAIAPPRTLQAILAAFEHLGKPYDFNFDFSTDNELVCSELVYKAFQPLNKRLFAPHIMSGRLMLEPNRIVEIVDESADAEPAPFDFVLFLDASEALQTVEEGDFGAFRQSWSRPKWDILQH